MESQLLSQDKYIITKKNLIIKFIKTRKDKEGNVKLKKLILKKKKMSSKNKKINKNNSNLFSNKYSCLKLKR